MSTFQVFQTEISKKQRHLISFISCTLYLIQVALLAALSSEIGINIFPKQLIDSFVLRGVIVQVMMMISVYIVLALNKEGYRMALILNLVSLGSAILYFLKSGSTASVPGMISYIAVIIIVTLIMKYKEQADDYLNQIDHQNKQLECSEKKLYEQANHDSLTRLPSRDFFIKKLEIEVERAKKGNQCLGVVYIDLDSFKTINDSLGHSAGDTVLIEVSKRFTAIQDHNYIVSRFGGDEFALLIIDVAELSDIEKILNKVMGALNEPFIVQGIEFFLTASAGIAVYPSDGDSVAELFKNADMSMYEAKRKGKNQYLFCNDDMKKEAIKKMMLTNSLHRALEKDELYLHYQPQISVETGSVVGFEALLRWDNADYGTIPPGTFIPLAEQTGLIKPIGLWVFKTVCEQCRSCNSQYKENIRISINFSVEQLKDINIVKHLTKIIEETGINPRNLEIEITESIAFCSDTRILEKLLQLKQLGFLIAIDDFGKEYSALNRIRSFPVDLLKIDMDFIHGISSGNPKDRAIVKTIIQLAKNLGVRVLAEGVETEEQYEFLKSEKCDEIQGYYFYKAMPASEAQKLL